MPENSTAVIYVLVDPRDGQVRYVGQTTKTVKSRLASHISRARNSKRNTHSSNWIRVLLKESLVPLIEIIREVSEEYKDETEIFCIAEYRRLGCRLTNVAEGGMTNSFKRSQESKEKNRIGAIEQWERLDDKTAEELKRVFQENAKEYRSRIESGEVQDPRFTKGHVTWNKGKNTSRSSVQKMMDTQKTKKVERGFRTQITMMEEIASKVGHSWSKVDRSLKGRSHQVLPEIRDEIWNFYLTNRDDYPKLKVVPI